MSTSYQQPSHEKQSASEDETLAFPAPEVEFLPGGKVQLTYVSQAAYLHDFKLLKGE